MLRIIKNKLDILTLSNITKSKYLINNYNNINLKYFNHYKTSIRMLSNIPQAPADPIMGLNEQFKKDTHPQKINLSVGAYRDEHGRPLVLNSVNKAKEYILNDNHEYAGIAGIQEFCHNTINFAFGKNNPNINFNNIATIQTISGTGACRIAGEFLSRFGEHKQIYLPNPTWSNHIPIMKESGLNVKFYSYYDKNYNGINETALLTDIYNANESSSFLFHVCAHNPTGFDPSRRLWHDILDIVKERGHYVLFDCAYQGFATGDLKKDAYPIQLFLEAKQNFMLAQSYSKNFGLYGERVGALSVFTNSPEEKIAVDSQLKAIARPMYSNPPLFGARIVNTILEDDNLFNEWKNECKAMSNRIKKMRNLLHYKLSYRLPYYNWDFIINQIGMFCYTGLNKDQVNTLINEYHIYMTNDGRISMSGLNEDNLEYFCTSVYNVLN